MNKIYTLRISPSAVGVFTKLLASFEDPDDARLFFQTKVKDFDTNTVGVRIDEDGNIVAATRGMKED